MAHLAISLLGPFQVTLDGRQVTGFESAAERALLAYLAAQRTRAHQRDLLAELLWPNRPRGSARANLRHTLARLRRAIDDRHAQPPYLLPTRATLQFNPASDATIDVVTLTETLRRVPPATPPEVAAALALRRGPFLEDVEITAGAEFEEWRMVVTEQIDRLAAQGYVRLADACVEQGDLACAARWTEQRLALEPWNEEAHQQLIWQLAMSGQTSAALHQFDVCRQRLMTELGVEPQPTTQALITRIRSGELAGQASAVTRVATIRMQDNTHTQIHVPPRPASFLGRERELAQVARQLADPACRLLTVLAPGGMGKTWLAIAAAHAEVGHFRDGVWFVDLTPVDAPADLAGAILRALLLPPSGPGPPVARLLDYLWTQQILLVLDNFEHLLDGATVLNALLDTAPGLKILVTSRARLRLSREWLLPLGGLQTPPARDAAPTGTQPEDASGGAPAQAQDFASVRLFLRQVQRINPGFQPSPADVALIGGICRHLEGMPLGVEMAAGWARSLSLDEIAAAIARGLDLFTTALRDVPARHRSMHAVFDHSWRMLDGRQRALLRQLSIFRGGCTLAAATAVTGATPAEMEDLVDQSWLRVNGQRFVMHELMRQYAAEKLAQEHLDATDEPIAAVHRRHCAFFADMTNTAERTLNWDVTPVLALFADFGNLEAAWHWAVANGDLDATRRMMNSLFFIAEVNGWMGLMLPFFERAAQMMRTRPTGGCAQRNLDATLVLTYMLYIITILNDHLGRISRGDASLAEARRALDAVAEPDRDARWVEEHFVNQYAVNLLNLSWGRYQKAQTQAQFLLHFLQTHDFPCYPWRAEIGTRFWQMQILDNLTVSTKLLGDYPTARRYAEAAISLCTEMGEFRFKAHHLSELADLLRLCGEYAEAEGVAQNALRLSARFEDRINHAYAAVMQSALALDQGKYATARAHLETSLTVGLETGEHFLYTRALVQLARCARAQGDYDQAHVWLADAVHACTQPDIPYSNQLAGIALEQGYLACAAACWSEARRKFEDALAVQGCTAAETQEAHLGRAVVAQAQGDTARARRLLNQVSAHPATAAATRADATALLLRRRSSVGNSTT